MDNRKASLKPRKIGQGAPNSATFGIGLSSCYFDDLDDLRGIIEVTPAHMAYTYDRGVTGFYTDEFCDETLNPVVISVRGKNRMYPRFYSGYEESVGGFYVIDLTSYTENIPREGLPGEYLSPDYFEEEHEWAKAKAGKAAFSMAEEAAEKERDYRWVAHRESVIEYEHDELSANRQEVVRAIKVVRAYKGCPLELDFALKSNLLHLIGCRNAIKKTIKKIRLEISRGY
jgi:hypothetical protein